MSDNNDWFTEPSRHDANEAAQPGQLSAGTAMGLASDTNAGVDAGTSTLFQVDYAELEQFAQEHDLNAQELVEWASGDPEFPERYLATHGKVNFGTYLKIVEFMASKQIAGTTFAEYNVQTSTALRASIALTKATEEANAAAIKASPRV
ncbi:hypothetical protein DSM43518_03325 [Mycobacterium marinum]|uniref:type VII secretion target n=1 Tax=Mycobacterium marinum TaxID=1781 RepID=UPI000E3C419E|nr:type VII secretion target [Mycobacterium marinum]RFZ07583.1 hypothetical protein DSM43518_03325 [Mycobacterium marinum]